MCAPPKIQLAFWSPPHRQLRTRHCNETIDGTPSRIQMEGSHNFSYSLMKQQLPLILFQHLMDCFNQACQVYGQTICQRKTKVMQWTQMFSAREQTGWSNSGCHPWLCAPWLDHLRLLISGHINHQTHQQSRLKHGQNGQESLDQQESNRTQIIPNLQGLRYDHGNQTDTKRCSPLRTTGVRKLPK